MAMITLGLPLAARAAGHAASSIQWGDVATWATAAVAVAALIAALVAGGKLSAQVRLQGEQLADQRTANAKQAQVLDAQLRAIERQQADAVTVTGDRWSGKITGVRPDKGPDTHSVVITNSWHRPIWKVACRIVPAPGDLMHEPALVGWVNELQGGLDQIPGQTTVDLVRAGRQAGFVFIYEIADYPDATVTVRFTDDADLHWQIDPDLHLHKLDSRDDW
jgi:hypothetical protein